MKAWLIILMIFMMEVGAFAQNAPIKMEPETAPVTSDVFEGPRVPSSGEDLARLMQGCSRTNMGIQTGLVCKGFEAGVISGSVITARRLGASPLFCLPLDLPDSAVEQAIIKELSNPAALKMPASQIILVALTKTFPCASADSNAKSPPGFAPLLPLPLNSKKE